MKKTKIIFSMVVAIMIVSLSACITNSEKEATAETLYEWYIPNGIATYKNTTPETRVYDITGFTQEWLQILNLEMLDAEVILTYYTETEQPKQMTVTVPGGRNKPLFQCDGQMLGLVDVNQLYGIRLKSNRKVLVQFSRFESETNSKDGIPSNHIQSNIAYPGPLGANEHKWAYADCWSLTSDSTWIEREWLNILNPSMAQAEVKVIFINRNTGEQTSHDLKIDAERIFALNLLSLPSEIYRENVGYSVLVESTQPVVAMQLRRFYHIRNQSPRGIIGLMAFPLGDFDLFK